MRAERVSWIALPAKWYHYVVIDGVDISKSGLYRWDIEGVGSYIGKYTSIDRPTKEYPNNVLKLANGAPYRKSKPDKYRTIHRKLEEAIRLGHVVTLTILQNVAASDLKRREDELIEVFGSLNDPPFNGAKRKW